jgi:hypothetical protein
LNFIVPSSGSYATIQGATGPSPDLVIENPSTQNTVIAEVRVAGTGHPISFSTLPSLKLMKASFPSRFRYVLFTVGEVPDSLRNGLEEEEIELVRVATIEDAVRGIEAIAASLDTPLAAEAVKQKD